MKPLNITEAELKSNGPLEIETDTENLYVLLQRTLRKLLIMENIKSQIENPKGLHARYNITKVKWDKNPNYGKSLKKYNNDPQKDWCEYIETEVEVDEDAEYFVLRLDTGGSDIEHIKACRIGIHAYAMAIQASIPELAKDLIERYPLL